MTDTQKENQISVAASIVANELAMYRKLKDDPAHLLGAVDGLLEAIDHPSPQPAAEGLAVQALEPFAKALSHITDDTLESLHIRGEMLEPRLSPADLLRARRVLAKAPPQPVPPEGDVHEVGKLHAAIALAISMLDDLEEAHFDYEIVGPIQKGLRGVRYHLEGSIMDSTEARSLIGSDVSKEKPE